MERFLPPRRHFFFHSEASLQGPQRLPAEAAGIRETRQGVTGKQLLGPETWRPSDQMVLRQHGRQEGNAEQMQRGQGATSTALRFSGEPFPPESAPCTAHSGSPSLGDRSLHTRGSCHSLPLQLVSPDQGSRTSPKEVKSLQPIGVARHPEGRRPATLRPNAASQHSGQGE